MNTDQIIAWLNNETMRNQVYHDHKENMMWVSFALFLTGVVATMLWLNSDVAIIHKSWLIVGVFIATLITIVFILWQFVNREKAGDKIDGIIRTTIGLLDTAPEHLDWEIHKDLILPTFVIKNMRLKIPTDRILLNLLILVVPILVACVALITMVCNK